MQPSSPVAKLVRTGVIGAIAGALTLGPAAPGALGQQPGTPNRLPPQVAQTPGADPGPIVTVSFPGGTVKDYVKAVQAAAAETSVNVLVPAEAAEVPLPPISLKGVTVKTALEALAYAYPTGIGVEHSFAVRSFGESSDSATAFAILYSRSRQPQTTLPAGPQFAPHYGPHAPAQIQVFSLTEFIDPPALARAEDAAMPVEVLLTAVEAALALGGDEAPEAEVRFHKESGILIVRGTSQQIDLVRSLLGELRKDLQTRWAVAGQQASREAERRFHQQRIELEMELVDRERKLLERRAAELKLQVEAGQIPSRDLEEVQLAADRKRTELDILRLELERPAPDPADRRSAPRPTTPAPGASTDSGTSTLASLLLDLQRQVAELRAELARLRADRDDK